MNFLHSVLVKFARSTNMLGKSTASFFKVLFNFLIKTICLIGVGILKSALLIKKAFRVKVLPAFKNVLRSFKNGAKRKFERFLEYIDYLKLVNKRKGALGAVKFALLGDESTSRFRRSMVSAVMTYVAPCMAVVLLLNVVAFAATSDYCVEVKFDGQTVAYVENETVYNEAEAEMRSRISYAGAVGESVELNPEFNVIKNYGHTLTNKDDLADILMTYKSADLVEGYGVYAGENFIGAVTDKTDIENYVNKYFEEAKAASGEADVSLSNDIFYIEGVYLASSVKTSEKIEETLLCGHEVTTVYKISDGDNVGSLAEKLGLSAEDFNRLNPEISDETLSQGGEINVKILEPYLSAVVFKTEVLTEEIPYETIKTEDDTLSENSAPVVKVKGEKGSKTLTYDIATRNGVELSRTLVSETVTSEPKNEEITIGTKKEEVAEAVEIQTQTETASTQLSDGEDSTATSSGYIWPVGGSGGYISCPFSGAYGHTGIDIAANLGTPVYAAADGVVVKAQTGYTGYGKLIVIQNNDGYITYYAHLNYIGVSVGQTVHQGEFIGEVGSTGNSTGPHLHFEVRSGRTYLNPLNFIY